MKLQGVFLKETVGFLFFRCYNHFMKSYIDEVLFEEAKNRMYGKVQGEKGIGTLAEKSVHSVLKYYFAPDETFHEQKIGRFVADIRIDGEIYEIQTKQFYLMKRKLEYFLKEHEVTIVYPVCAENTLHWVPCDSTAGGFKSALKQSIDAYQRTGITAGRKTRKKGMPYLFFQEIYGIKELLHHPNLHFILAVLSTEEYRLLDGYGPQQKKRATKTDKIPIRLTDLISIREPADYAVFLPDGLPETFQSSDFGRKAGISRDLAGIALNILRDMQIVERIGKNGNAYIYSPIYTSPPSSS